MTWRKTLVILFQSPKRGTKSREGYVREDGLIAMPPLRSDKLKAWKERMGIE